MKILYIGPAKSVHLTRWVNNIHKFSNDFQVIVFDSDMSKLKFNNKFLRFFLSSSTNNLEVEQSVKYSGLLLIVKKYLFSPIQFLLEIILNLILISIILLITRPKVIHVHWANSVSGFIAIIIGKIIKIPTVITPWGSDINEYIDNKLNNFSKFIVRTQIKFATEITCDSIYFSKKILQVGNFQKRISIIYFGTDCDYFCPNENKSIIKQKLNLLKDDIHILSNRSFEDVYDIPTIIHSFKTCANQLKNLKLILIGKGSKINEIKKLISELNLEQFIYLWQNVSDEVFLNSIQISDLYISAATSDGGLSASVAEAMACEIPCIITKYGDNENWIIENETGFLFTIGNSNELSKKILNYFLSVKTFEEIGKNSRKLIEKDLNIKSETLKMLTLYLKIIK